MTPQDVENTAALLDRFEADPKAVWPELTDRLCPGLDTAFPESVAALPRLARIAADRDPSQRHWVLYAAGPIVSSARRTPEGVAASEAHTSTLAELARLTAECLPLPLSLGDYVGLFQMYLAFEGVEVWDEHLDGLAEGEYEVDCPWCGVGLFVVMGEFGFFTSSEDYSLRDVERAPLRPAEPRGIGARLRERALGDGQGEVVRRLAYLFGDASCTDCGTAFSPAERIATRMRPA